jgi:tRNA G18 (ribose-2'-O)-methylase SpoU
MSRGFFGIGIQCCKTEINYGTLFRTANLFGADYLFLIGRRFKKQSSDTTASWRHIPTYSYLTFSDFYNNLPYNCQLVGIEMTEKAVLLERFVHPLRACYILGAEDSGLSREALEKCHLVIKLRGEYSMNVAVAGSIVIYHRTRYEPSNEICRLPTKEEKQF